MTVPSNYAALITAIDAILTTYGLSLFQVFGGRSTQPSLRELISLRWKLFSMTTPANYATLIAEIDVVIQSYGLSLQQVFGGRSTQPTLQELIDLRYELFEVGGGGGGSIQDVIVFNLSSGAATLGTSKDWIVYCPYAYTITSLILACETAPTGANLIVDLNKNGSSILSTKISIDATERTSVTAATPYVLTSTSLAAGDILLPDIDQIGTGGGTNVQLYLYVTRV